MKWLCVAAVLLVGCAHQQVPKPVVVHVTTYRAVPDACQPFEEQLRQMIMERDKWKKYARTLEKLP